MELHSKTENLQLPKELSKISLRIILFMIMFLIMLIIYSYIYDQCYCIKTHSRVSVVNKDVRHTSVLFTGTSKSPISTPHTSITTGSISIKFTYLMSPIYTTLHTKFEGNWPSSF